MKTKKVRTYSKITKEAARLLGLEIQLARKQRRMSESDLADRAGLSRKTVQKIEKGDLSISMGLAFEAAAVVGVKLFDPGPSRFSTAMDIDRVNDKIALLPRRIRAPKVEEGSNDF
ncbi:MAG: transcriptional regulator [Bdellovibrio sp.]|nr:MAG: transcriptional regulator [Bdellovibrio sp.]